MALGGFYRQPRIAVWMHLFSCLGEWVDKRSVGQWRASLHELICITCTQWQARVTKDRGKKIRNEPKIQYRNDFIYINIFLMPKFWNGLSIEFVKILINMRVDVLVGDGDILTSDPRPRPLLPLKIRRTSETAIRARSRRTCSNLKTLFERLDWIGTSCNTNMKSARNKWTVHCTLYSTYRQPQQGHVGVRFVTHSLITQLTSNQSVIHRPVTNCNASTAVTVSNTWCKQQRILGMVQVSPTSTWIIDTFIDRNSSDCTIEWTTSTWVVNLAVVECRPQINAS